jgi:cation:H+ antiporter
MRIYLALVAGLICAAGGGELFVRGTVGLARSARVSPGIIAATIAAFAASSPELTVGVTSALHGNPQISLGNVLGSNVINVALILGFALLMQPIEATREILKRDFPIALLAPVLLGVLLLLGNRLSRFDGAILLIVFCFWLFLILKEMRRQRALPVGAPGKKKPLLAAAQSVVGLAVLILAGKLIVYGGTGLARAYGLSEFVIGATVVSVGTSIPELATAIMSRVRGHDEIGLGAILGSNIYNGMLVVAVASLIKPFDAPLNEAVPALFCGFAAVLLLYPPDSRIIGRWRGAPLISVYLLYLITAC